MTKVLACLLAAACSMALAACAPMGGSSEGIVGASAVKAVWSPDNGDGTYKNPIIYADYSDPDVCRAGDDFYMTASSFSSLPGLPILHSKDLVNWRLIGHAIAHYPVADFDLPQHGKGVWAPAIRYHNGEFYIYYGDPDNGIYMTKTKDPAGPWEPLVLVKQAKGWIDTCPLWDENGKAYLVHGFAKSRSGINNALDICRMASDGKSLLDEGTRMFDGGTTDSTARPTGTPTDGKYTTVEGPKFYKRNGFYYVMAPGGGVGPGYQIVFRSKNVLGPYESRVVLDRGSTNVNGPHQGGWVDTPDGKEDWFIHFQEVLPYGRILHLEPVKWVNDWPIMGKPYNDQRGEPVAVYKKPNVGKLYPIETPQTSDEFTETKLGLQWQWWANDKPEWISLTARPGYLRMMPVAMDKETLLFNRPNLLLQKFPADAFTVTTSIDVSHLGENEIAGLILAGNTTTSLACRKTARGVHIIRSDYTTGARPAATIDTLTDFGGPFPQSVFYLKMTVAHGGICTFSWSGDSVTFNDCGPPVRAINASWIGAKAGLFCNAPAGAQPEGDADVDWFRIE